jgi:hypothetical protein
MGTHGAVGPEIAERFAQLDTWLRAHEENEHLEFKEANHYRPVVASDHCRNC